MCEEISFCGSAEREGIVGPGNGEEGGILSVSLEVSLRAYRVLYLFSKIGKSKIDLQTFLFLFVLKHKCNALQPLTINTNTHLLFYSPCRVKCMAYPWKELPGKPFDFWDLTFSLLVFLQRTARPTSYRNLLWGHTLFTNNWLRQEYCVHSKPSFLKKKKKNENWAKCYHLVFCIACNQDLSQKRIWLTIPELRKHDTDYSFW